MVVSAQGNNYNEDYLNAVLEFLEIEDINRDCISAFSATISYDDESVITLTFSLQELKSKSVRQIPSIL